MREEIECGKLPQFPSRITHIESKGDLPLREKLRLVCEQCWAYKPGDRPPAGWVRERLQTIRTEHERQSSEARVPSHSIGPASVMASPDITATSDTKNKTREPFSLLLLRSCRKRNCPGGGTTRSRWPTEKLRRTRGFRWVLTLLGRLNPRKDERKY